MVLLELHLTLHMNQSESAVSTSRFLGGVIHGTFERLVLTHAPVIGHDLGIASESLPKRYAILPPPFDWKMPETQLPVKMKCGIVLYNKKKKYIEVIVALLKQWHEIRYERHTNTVQCDQVFFHIPGNKSVVYDYLEQKPVDTQFYLNQMRPASSGITLNFNTPLKRKNLQPPQLLRIVRSVADRIRELEPALADLLGLKSLAWIESEEQIRRLSIAYHHLKQVDWKYWSTSHENFIPCTGLLGQIHYEGNIPSAITTLLHWGQWFGAGQSTALGQGMYYIDEPLIRF